MSIKMSKKPVLGHSNSPKTDFLDILIDFWGHFSGGSNMALFGPTLVRLPLLKAEGQRHFLTSDREDPYAPQGGLLEQLLTKGL